MKKSYYYIFFFTFLTSLLSCQQEEDKGLTVENGVGAEMNIEDQNVSGLDTLAECTITNEEDQLRKELFPFEFRDFDVSRLKRFFSNTVTVDSASFSNEGYTYMIYKFKKADSYMSFFVKPKEEESPWFYIDESSIDNDLIQFKKGVKIGMPKNEVFNILGVNQLNCDTLHIQEGDLFTYYDFIFEKNKLKRIIIIPSE